jgi:hypothetical protein
LGSLGLPGISSCRVAGLLGDARIFLFFHDTLSRKLFTFSRRFFYTLVGITIRI